MEELTEREKKLVGYINSLILLSNSYVAFYNTVRHAHEAIVSEAEWCSDFREEHNIVEIQKEMVEYLNSECGLQFALKKIDEDNVEENKSE
jgi:hypothetical protein